MGENRYLLRMSDSVNKGWGRKIDWLTLKRIAGVWISWISENENILMSFIESILESLASILRFVFDMKMGYVVKSQEHRMSHEDSQ